MSRPMWQTLIVGLVCVGYLEGMTTSSTSPTTTQPTSSTDSSTMTSTSAPTLTSTTTMVSTLASPVPAQNVLLCFQCTASSSNEPCVTDIAGMANSSTNEIYLKNCTATNPAWNRCMIQSVEVDGKIKFFHRDCHDGIYFPTSLNSSRFFNLALNNVTTCDLIAERSVCYTPCDTNFCNGPTLIPRPNVTDPCSAYFENPYDVTLAPDQVCGAPGDRGKSKLITAILLGLLMSIIATSWASVSQSSL